MIAAKKRESAFELSLLVERSKVDVVSAFLRNGEEQFILNRVQQWLRSGSLEATAASQLSSLALQAYLKKAVADTSELERTNSGFRNFLTSCRFADSTQCLRPLIDAHLYHSALIFVQAHRAGPQLTQCLCSLSFWPTIGSFVALLTASEVVQLFDDEGDRCNLLALLQRLSSFLLHANSRLVWQIWKAYNLRQKRVRAFLAEAQLKSNPNCTDIAKAVVSLFLKAAIFLNWELRDAAFASLSVPGYHTAKIPLSCNNSGLGDNKYGQLGLPGIADRLGTIGVLDVKCFLAHVCQVTCGHYHSCVVDCDGNAYSWGWNVHGQLGHGTVQAVKLPKLIAEFQRQRCSVVSVAGGMAHTVFLCASGAVYACGSNAYGQLGIQYSSTEKKCSLPLKVPLPKKIRLLCAGSFRNLALADSAEDSPELFAWGISPQTLKFLMIVQKQTKRTANEGGDPGNRQSLRG
ncbi:unnamed protein product, partial [Soboliphyme baturini]|uniref:Regulator of chromosome condensation (RCC1) family protein n=1 Tax=Soboliphyme baturini TaxID=241478 RepID=A0A183JB27_9BILA